jgi:hypothetical protein
MPHSTFIAFPMSSHELTYHVRDVNFFVQFTRAHCSSHRHINIQFCTFHWRRGNGGIINAIIITENDSQSFIRWRKNPVSIQIHVAFDS